MENTFHIQWHITDRCNLRCLHCYQDSFSSKSALPVSSLAKVFSNIVSFVEKRGQKLVIDITGGEPLLYNGWKELFSMVYHHPAVKRTGIITNGFSLADENIKFLQEFKNLIIKISGEGINKQTFELFRGKGSYEKFLYICDILKEKFLPQQRILMFTLMKENLKEVPYIFDFIKKYTFGAFILERFIPLGRGRKISGSLISTFDWLYIIRTICNICEAEEDIEALLPYRGFMVRVTDKGAYDLFGAPCIIGTDGIAVMPDGSVFPCRRFPLPIGNLLKDKLEDIWEKSDVLEKLRNYPLKGKCKSCKITNCRGCRALAYSITGNFLEEDPMCYL
ncbi:MAG: radical SAM protein [Candidatus Omnitrophica bacterium]|nr:radical SAM protein [Candidatus Omnitrophota bacterium]